MLRSMKSLEGIAIGATDGKIGKVNDLYFDDGNSWVVRYLVVDTGNWLGGREVLVSPYSISQPVWADGELPVAITKEQIRNSPLNESDQPISRQFERGYLGYYGYPYYWGAARVFGEAASIPAWPFRRATSRTTRGTWVDPRPPSADDSGDPHLRSCNAVNGYRIEATDGEIGHVDGFLIDDSTWSIRYMVVNTSNWWMGHQVLISPEWIKQVSWADSRVEVAIDRQIIKDAPAYDATASLDRDAESKIYGHYGRASYWRNQRERAVA